ncbi:MAG: hypothetical protein JXR50_02495 [Prolixibacteraceae bacterium]|nr:hypothetical protein [Prolixibacteraceae bacterium]
MTTKRVSFNAKHYTKSGRKSSSIPIVSNFFRTVRKTCRTTAKLECSGKRIWYFATNSNLSTLSKYLVYGGDQAQARQSGQVISWNKIGDLI